jgi:glyoxylate reductase
VCQLADPINRDVLTAAAPSCKVVATCAVGFDNIDVGAASELGMTVTHTPDVLTDATADLTWALMLATARRLGEAERFVRSGAWHGWGMMQLLGVDVFGRTLGIVGAGRIGQAVARRASGFDMKVIYTARSDKPEMKKLGAKRVSLDALLAESDFVSLHVALTPDTRQLMGAVEFEKMKRGAILINTARGAVVDQSALIDALRNGRLAAAGLDVFDGEPAIPQALLKLENVVLLPHIGSATVTTRNRMAEMAARDVIAVLSGEAPAHPVSIP